MWDDDEPMGDEKSNPYVFWGIILGSIAVTLLILLCYYM